MKLILREPLDRIFSYEVPENAQDTRLDVFLCSISTGLSRSRIQALIKDEHAKVNNRPSKPSHKLKAGDRVSLSIPPPVAPILTPDDVDFQIIHEDTSLIVLSKPPGIVVHPAPGHSTGTLVHGLLKHCKDLSGIGGTLRPGIVHRLDKDTSGLMVVAKNDQAHASLARQFKSGLVKKQYIALVHGRISGEGGKMDLPIARHPAKRKEMAVVTSGGRRALTLWQKVAEFQSGFSLLSVSIKTGRTHQIRVHLSHEGHPVAGDPVYGYGRNWWKKCFNQKGAVLNLKRQMLHSERLGFTHPASKRYMEFEAPLPDDMKQVLEFIKWLDLQL
ncbi:MAG: RluA family pseudouridine synthase [Pseudomonadota bacterium]